MIDQSTGEALARWSVRAAVAFYLARIGYRCRQKPKSQPPATAEAWLWTAGCMCYLVHVVCVFHFVHHWSHGAAWQHTAEETERVVGLQCGDGLWVNYVFTIVWIADCIRLHHAAVRRTETNRLVDIAVAFFFAIIVINATVVFGPESYRWLAGPIVILLIWLRYKRDAPFVE